MFPEYTNNIYLTIVIYILIIIGVCVLYNILRKIHNKIVNDIKTENEIFYKMQVELIKNQLDPHFLFNALNSINFSIHKNDKKTASLNLGFFSKFLRGSTGSLDVFSRSLDEEIQYVKNYLLLEKFRFKDKFNYDFIITPDINKSVIVPKLILFSFIENALKKGILPKGENGKITITIDAINEQFIHIFICDDGLHRDLEDENIRNITLMNRIICYFNKLNQNKIIIKNTNNKNTKENKVEIKIPVDYKYDF
jgi:LytS/YehU family sensor histidine kinase